MFWNTVTASELGTGANIAEIPNGDNNERKPSVMDADGSPRGDFYRKRLYLIFRSGIINLFMGLMWQGLK